MKRETPRGVVWSRTALFVAAVVWVVLVGAGIRVAVAYETTRGARGDAPERWPADSGLSLAAGRYTLVMFVHPRCPCSRASLAGLDVVMKAQGERASAVVAFMHPGGEPADWGDTDTWDQAGRIPGTTRFADVDGREATRFGARTSGHTVLYDPTGHLVFSGGLTDSRGHAGDSVGRQTLLGLLTDGTLARPTTAVFGCPLEDSMAEATTARGARP
jgi:hypothetical protein